MSNSEQRTIGCDANFSITECTITYHGAVVLECTSIVTHIDIDIDIDSGEIKKGCSPIILIILMNML